MLLTVGLVVYLAGALVTARVIRLQFNSESIAAVVAWPVAWAIWALIILPVVTAGWFAERLGRK
jgi:hypothetical protein